MKTTRKISTLIVAAAIAITPLALASPAHAAELNNVAASSSGPIGTTGTNATPITVSATVATGASADEFRVILPTGWSFVTTANFSSVCPDWITFSGITPPATVTGCLATNGPPDRYAALVASDLFRASQSISITFGANTLNVGSERTFTVQTNDAATVVDSGTATLPGGGSSGGSTPSPAPAPNSSLTSEQNSGSAAQLAQTGGAHSLIAPASIAMFMLLAGSLALARRRRTS